MRMVTIEPTFVWPAPLAQCPRRWPFQRLCDQLCMDVLHPQWEVRHGAAAALREVLTAQAGAAGVHAPLSDDPSGKAGLASKWDGGVMKA